MASVGMVRPGSWYKIDVEKLRPGVPRLVIQHPRNTTSFDRRYEVFRLDGQERTLGAMEHAF